MMINVDESEAVIGELFGNYTADQIFVIVGKTGLRIDWQLTQEEAFSDKTRRRAYATKVTSALKGLSDDQRKSVLSGIATQVRPLAAVEKKKDDLLPLFARGQYELDYAVLYARASAESPLALIVGDLDYFKNVNDTFGHAAGDEVLIAVATVLSKAASGKGFAYRYGGEEMCLLLPNFDSGEAAALAERARREIAELKFNSVKRQITVSFGVAVFPHDVNDPSELFKVADSAMYVSKSSGRNRVSQARATKASVEVTAIFSNIDDRVQTVDLAAEIIRLCTTI